MVKEANFSKRLEVLKGNEQGNYEQLIEQRNEQMVAVNAEIKDIVFDYYNIITKEYEIAFEKYKADEEYKKQSEEIKK